MASSLERLRNKKNGGGRVRFNENHDSQNLYSYQDNRTIESQNWSDDRNDLNHSYQEELVNDYKRNDMNHSYQEEQTKINSSDYQRDDYQRDVRHNDYQRDVRHNDYQVKSELINPSEGYSVKPDYSEEESDFLNTMSLISNSIKEKELMKNDSTQLDTVRYEPCIRSLIRKNAVLKHKPDIELHLSCDYFNMNISGDKAEVIVNEFRKGLQSHLDCIFKTITKLVINYREDIIVDSASLNASVKSKVDVSSSSEFRIEDRVELGSAMETIFDRLGIGYLLD